MNVSVKEEGSLQKEEIEISINEEEDEEAEMRNRTNDLVNEKDIETNVEVEKPKSLISKHSFQLILLNLSLVCTMSTWFSASAILSDLLKRFEEDISSKSQSSFFTICVQIGFVSCTFISSVLSLPDRIPIRLLFFSGAVLSSLSNLMLVFENIRFEVVLFCRFLTGVGLAFNYPLAMKGGASWFLHNRGLALGSLVGSLTVGSALPHLVKGLGGAKLNVVVLGTSACACFGGILVLFFFRVGPYMGKSPKFEWKNIGLLVKSYPVVMATLGYIGHQWELYAMWAWYSEFYHAYLNEKDHSKDNARMSSIFTFFVISAGFFGCLLGGFLSDRIGRTKTTTIFLLISGSISLVVGMIPSTSTSYQILLMILSVIWGFCVIADSAQFSTIITEVSNKNFVGTALSLQMSIGYIVTIISIYLVPVLFETVGWNWVWVFITPGPFLGAIAMVSLYFSKYKTMIAGGKG